MALSSFSQSSFAAGIVKGTRREDTPTNALWSAENLLLDDRGLPYKRGGVSYKSSAGLGALGLLMLWDGYLPPGQRTVFVSADATNKLGVLDTNDSSVVEVAAVAMGVDRPVRGVTHEGKLHIIAPNGSVYVYGGSRKTSAYGGPGAITVTNNSPVVTGAGTLFSANADAGMILGLVGPPAGEAHRFYVVKSVDSNTQLTLAEPYRGATAAGASFVLAQLSTSSAPWSAANITGEVLSVMTAPADLASVAGRLVGAKGRLVAFSESALAGGAGTAKWGAPSGSTQANNFHELPSGVNAIGLESLRGTCVVFTTQGVWMIYGMENDLTDDFGNVQHRIERINDELVLWGTPGVATWADTLVVPAQDSIYLIAGAGPPREVGASIKPLYQSYVRAGHRPGGAVVYRQTYFLPILDSSNVWVDTLACRLDRPAQVGGSSTFYFPWMRLSGFGAQVAGFARRAGGTSLLAASRATSSRVLDCSGYFEPAAANKNDADGTAVTATAKTGFYRIGRGSKPSVIRKVKLRGKLTDAASDNPTVAAVLETPTSASLTMTGSLTEGEGNAYALFTPTGGQPGLRTFYGGLNLTQSNAAQDFTLSEIEVVYRQTGKAP